MFTLGGSEFFIIALVALLLFGPDKVPQLARTIGRFTREFNKYKDIMESTLRMEIQRAEGPTKDTITVEERIAKASAASQEIIDARDGAAGGAALGALEEPVDGEALPAAEPPGQVADETDEEDEG